jgi:hypothetical protein
MFFQDWLTHHNARCEKEVHRCYSRSNWKVVMVVPFTRDYECHQHYDSPQFVVQHGWTHFLGTI